jgi:arginine deiminase
MFGLEDELYEQIEILENALKFTEKIVQEALQEINTINEKQRDRFESKEHKLLMKKIRKGMETGEIRKGNR